MKKIFLFVFLFFAALCVYAQGFDINTKADSYNSYDIVLTLKQDSTVAVTEKFTIYHGKNYSRYVFRRDTNVDKKLQDVFLYCNGTLIDTKVERTENGMSIIPKEIMPVREGKRMIILNYKVPREVFSSLKEDRFKWDLALYNLPYKFDDGSVTFKVEGYPTIKKSKIIFIHPDAVMPFDLEEGFKFPIFTAFEKKLNVTLDISFEKGFFQNTAIDETLLKGFLQPLFNLSPILIMIFMIFYCYFTWRKYGKDPTGPFVTEYNPPRGITPAFAKFLLNRKRALDFSHFIITLIHLSLNKYIEITSYKGDVCIKSLKDTNSNGLVEEDKIIYDSLFAYSPQIVLNKENSIYVSNAIRAMFQRILVKGEEYFTPNYWYAALPTALLVGSFFLLFAFRGKMLGLAAICFIVCLVAFSLFMMLIDNVSPRYRKVYCQLMGFKQYMKIAEEGRVHFSDPLDEQRLFCDYLAYAYAFGMEERIITKIKYKFDSEAIVKYLTECIDISGFSSDYMLETLRLMFTPVNNNPDKYDDLF